MAGAAVPFQFTDIPYHLLQQTYYTFSPPSSPYAAVVMLDYVDSDKVSRIVPRDPMLAPGADSNLGDLLSALLDG